MTVLKNCLLKNFQIVDFKNTSDIEQISLIIKDSKKKAEISFDIPLIDIIYFWHPAKGNKLNLVNEWEQELFTQLNYSMPIFTLLDSEGSNRYTICHDQDLRKVVLRTGVVEETAQIVFKFEFLADNGADRINLRIDKKIQFFSDAIKRARNWIAQINSCIPLKTNEYAFDPVYSTWYSFHQAVSEKKINSQIPNFADYGLKTLIVDDGWQTDDLNRRYAYAGEWQVIKKKFPNFRNHIDTAQKEDIKYMLWLTVPYVGIKTQAYATFKNQLLYVDEFQKAGILDPRFPEVREYLVQTIDSLVDCYHVDGLKLDFIDSFIEKEPCHNEAMDTANLEEAVSRLLGQITANCLTKNDDFLIEYRQDYISPTICQYANMIRVKDCPENFVQNRIGIAELRLLCPYLAVHSDMIMFHPAVSALEIALHLLNCLYGVIQISVDLNQLRDDQKKIILFWLHYQQKNREILYKEDFFPMNPQSDYDCIQAGNEEFSIVTCYRSNKVIDLDLITWTRGIDLINATIVERLIFRNEKLIGRKVHMTCYDKFGNKISCGDYTIQSINEIVIDACGRIHLEME